MLLKRKSVQFRLTCVTQKWFVYVIAVVRRDHKQRIEMYQSEIDNSKGIFLLWGHQNSLLLWFYFLIGLLCSAKSMCQLGKSGMFLMRVIWKVGMMRLLKKRKESIFCWNTYVVLCGDFTYKYRRCSPFLHPSEGCTLYLSLYITYKWNPSKGVWHSSEGGTVYYFGIPCK